MPRLPTSSLLREIAAQEPWQPEGWERCRRGGGAPAARAADSMRLEGEVLYAPKLLPEAGELTALACAVATLGPRLEQRVASLFAARQASVAIALDQVGNRLLYSLSRHVQDRMLVAGRRGGPPMGGGTRPGGTRPGRRGR